MLSERLIEMMMDQPNLPALSANPAYTRRQIIAGSAFGLCSLVIVNAQDATSAKAKTIIATRAIHQEEDFKAGPARIYEALLDAKQFSAFSGGRAAEIHREVGGTFTIFAGHIVGRNLELVPNQRIVQAWRVVPWPEGIYSVARFELVEKSSGTRVTLDHTGFPPELAEHLESGWIENYWTPLQKYLA
jgi:activator of HSP90 ATPase